MKGYHVFRNIVLLASLVAAVSLSACSSNTQQPGRPAEKQATGQGSLESVTTEEGNQNQKEPEPIADDEIVNSFITSYNAISGSPITEVEDGNIRTKFYGSSYGYYLELSHANDTGKIYVSISQTDETAPAGVAGMRRVFRDMARAVDPSLTDDEIYSCFDGLLSGGVIAENQPLGSILVRFVPDVELSNGTSRGHIELAAQ